MLPKLIPLIVDAANFVIAIAAELFMSAFTIVSLAIIVLLTVPVSPLVTTVPAVVDKVIVLLAAVVLAMIKVVPLVEPLNVIPVVPIVAEFKTGEVRVLDVRV